MPRLREAERQKPDKDRAPESALVYDARMRVIRDFEELLIVALRRDEPGFFEDVLEVIQQIAVLGCTEFRRREMYFLPRNPIAYLRAIVEAYRTGKTINSILGWAPDQPRNAHQAAEARRFLKALTMLVAPDDPGYAKSGGLRMSEEANGGSAAAPTITPVPVAEMPTQEIEIKSVQLVFQGKGELELAGVFEEAAKKHGGWEQFILLLAASLAKQKDKK